MTLADLLNAPSDFPFGDRVYKLRQPTLLECATYQRWLEQEARAGAARATELPEEDRRQLLRDVQADVAAQAYCWGGDVCIRSLQTPAGVAKLMSIVCADQGLSERDARRAVDQRLTEIAALIAGELEGDPSGKSVAGLLRHLGLPPNYFASSSSPSPTRPTPATSGSSAPSAPSN